jgi:hypothetical protein
MTTITIDKELLEQVVNKLLTCWPKSDPLVNELRAALAAPATAPEKTVKEIMEFVRHYAANTFSSATLEDKIRRSLTAPATAPEQQECKWTFDDDESNTWASGCGELWSFIDGGPAENRVKYCHGCGKPVVLEDKP